MNLLRLDQKGPLEDFLRQDVYLHIYALGDLDDYFWPHTEWLGLCDDGSLHALLMLYHGLEPPILLALARSADIYSTRVLLEMCLAELKTPFYVHASPELADFFRQHYVTHNHGEHLKMRLQEPDPAAQVDVIGTELATPDDVPELEELFAHSYPDHAFDPRMVRMGQFYCIRKSGKIVSAAGIHVYSPHYGVAAIGNVVTHPEFRGQGMGTRVTARTICSLQETVPHIGLNVKSDNTTAIQIYQKLGFVVHRQYYELTALQLRT